MTTKRLRGKAITHLAFMDSDTERDVEYEIGRKADGTLACACMSFVFNRETPKSCKHLKAYRIDVKLAVQEAPARVEAARRTATERTVQVDAEVFTIRRAMSFGAIPGGAA